MGRKLWVICKLFRNWSKRWLSLILKIQTNKMKILTLLTKRLNLLYLRQILSFKVKLPRKNPLMNLPRKKTKLEMEDQSQRRRDLNRRKMSFQLSLVETDIYEKKIQFIFKKFQII